MIIDIFVTVALSKIFQCLLFSHLKHNLNIVVTCVGEEMIQHYCTKLEESQIYHDI